MKKTEARWQTVWNHYLREYGIRGFFELKHTDSNSFAFNKIEVHQYEGLQATEKNGLVWKLSDEDRRQKPCDAISIPALPSYLVIKFPDAYYMIRIAEIVKMKENGAISIARECAEKIAERIIVIA